MENILLGYGLKVYDMSMFKPLYIAKLFNFQSDEISIEELEELDDEDMLDILTFSEGINLQNILEKVAEQSSIIECKYNGVNHCLVFPPMYSWEVTEQLRRLQPNDVIDEIIFLLKPLLQPDYTIDFLLSSFEHIYYENI